MKSAAIPLLRCSMCHEPTADLKLVDATTEHDEIVSGALVCARGHRFPIHRGIADFVSEHEAVGGDSPVYDTMWRMHEDRSYPGRVAEYEAKFQRFAKLPGRLSDYIEGKFVLDGGCGEGRFTYLASALGARHVIALDYSRYALERARIQAGNPANCTFIRASILNPPLAPRVFDLVFSMGVVHHTPDSEQSYRAIRASLKTGGYLAIYVYRLLSLPLAVWPLRLITRRLSVARVQRLSEFFGWHYDSAVKPTIPLANFGKRLGRWDLLGLSHISFEGLSTPYLREHTRGEVVKWFTGTQMEVLSSSHLVSVSGRAVGPWPTA